MKLSDNMKIPTAIILFWGIVSSSLVNAKNLSSQATNKDIPVLQINTADDLLNFALEVNGGNNKLCAQLNNDIDIRGVNFPMIGSKSSGYGGTFKGNHHTITFQFHADTEFTSLFSYVNQGTIENLCVKGDILTSYRESGGLCGYMNNGSLRGCISSVNIVSEYEGDAAHGGLVSCTNGFCLIDNCLFEGSIFGSNTTCCGGLVGWCYDVTKIKNSLVLGTIDVNPEDTDSYVIARNVSRVTGSNNYAIANGCKSQNGTMIVDKTMLENGNICYLLNGQLSAGIWTLKKGNNSHPIPFPTGESVEYSSNFIIPNIETESQDTIEFPQWAKNLVIYEIATKNFNSPNIPETGTFSSLKKKIPYLKKLGINAIWLTGYSWCDDHHFYNIWTQYAAVRPDSIDPSLGTREDFRSMIKYAHKHGIRVFLDVITHGVMSYSPLIKEHPNWFKGGSWGMTDYDWNGKNKELDEWWVKVWTDYAVKDGIDGFRLDVAMFRPDLWKKIRRNVLEAGREIVVLQEGHNSYVEGAADSYQTYNILTVPGEREIKGIKKTAFVWNVGTYYHDDFPKETALCTAEERGAFLASIEVSCHDNGWNQFKSGQNPYVTNGSRAFMGYSALLTPAIPVMFSGEEWNADYVPVPHLAGSLYGDKRKNDGYWLYGSWLQWDQLKLKEKKQMLEDTRQMLSLRKKYSDLIYAVKTATQAPVLPVSFQASTQEDLPVPYVLYNKKKALLVAANPHNYDVDLQLQIPVEQIECLSKGQIVLRDVWNKKGRTYKLPADGKFNISIPKDYMSRGGLSVWELSVK